jgi:hypothetical protein
VSDQDVPSAHEARSACWAAGLLLDGVDADEQALDAYRQTSTGGRFSPEDLARGQAWLERLELLEREEARLVVTPGLVLFAELELELAAGGLLLRAIERIGPLWLRAAAGGPALRAHFIPPEPARALSELFVDEPRREALLLGAARTHEARAAARIAGKGEQLVLEACRKQLEEADLAELATKVQQTGRLAGSLGYEIVAPRRDGSVRHIEVKAVRSWRWRLTLFVHRGEVEAGLADPDWSLVVCDASDEDAPSILGWCGAQELSGLLPADQHSLGRWTRAALIVNPAVLQEGLPPV